MRTPADRQGRDGGGQVWTRIDREHAGSPVLSEESGVALQEVADAELDRPGLGQAQPVAEQVENPVFAELAVDRHLRVPQVPERRSRGPLRHDGSDAGGVRRVLCIAGLQQGYEIEYVASH